MLQSLYNDCNDDPSKVLSIKTLNFISLCLLLIFLIKNPRGEIVASFQCKFNKNRTSYITSSSL